MRVRDVVALYDYHYWATGRVLDTATLITPEQFAAPAPVPWRSLRGTLVHLLGGEWGWLARWEGRPAPPRPPDDASVTVDWLAERWRASEAGGRAYLASNARCATPAPAARRGSSPSGTRSSTSSTTARSIAARPPSC